VRALCLRLLSSAQMSVRSCIVAVVLLAVAAEAVLPLPPSYVPMPRMVGVAPAVAPVAEEPVVAAVAASPVPAPAPAPLSEPVVQSGTISISYPTSSTTLQAGSTLWVQFSASVTSATLFVFYQKISDSAWTNVGSISSYATEYSIYFSTSMSGLYAVQICENLVRAHTLPPPKLSRSS
jgi:hypothetical protein